MSNEEPTITVTRGSKKEAPERSSSSSEDRSRSSSGLGLPGPGTLVSGVVRGVRNVWWAGLGVFAVAQNAGSQVFDALVEEGKSWEQKRRERTEATARQVRQLTKEEGTVEAVERRVSKEVNNILQRVGVPRRSDLDELRDQVDALSEKIERLSQSVEEAKEDNA